MVSAGLPPAHGEPIASGTAPTEPTEGLSHPPASPLPLANRKALKEVALSGAVVLFYDEYDVAWQRHLTAPPLGGPGAAPGPRITHVACLSEGHDFPGVAPAVIRYRDGYIAEIIYCPPRHEGP